MVQTQWLIKTGLLLLILVHAEAQRSRQAEVNVNNVNSAGKIKFGNKLSPVSNIQRNNSRSSRPTNSQQRLMQYEIPIVQKNNERSAAISVIPNTGQQSNAKGSSLQPIAINSEVHLDSSDSAVSNAKQAKPVDVEVAVGTPYNLNHGRDAELKANNNKNNSVGRKQRKQYLTDGLQRSSGILTGRPQSRKSAVTKTTTTSTTTTTTTTTPRPRLIQNLPINNPFNIFSPEFWRFSSPITTPVPTTKRPPKKYVPSTTVPFTSEGKISSPKTKIAPKPKPTSSSTTSTTTTTTTTTTPKITSPTKKDATSEGPFRIALPTFSFFNAESQRESDPQKEKEKRATVESLRERFNCPRESEVRFQLFPKICKTDQDCSVWNREELCCEIFGAKSCVSGLPKPLEESSHAPILGLIQRKCPSRPLAELWWEVKECETDMDCWPRVCCPDGRRRYCRTSQPELEAIPVPVRRSFDYLSEYLECTPPPPPIFDLHPKACTSTLDCFPNVCCQEAGLRHCRPPKKSVLTLMTNFLNVDFVKRLTQNIVIK